MITTVVLLLVGLALLLGGGESLIRGASALARRLGVQPLVIGLTVVAFGTSVPELIVNLLSTFGGRGEIAFGNVVGSNLANLGLILGLAALLRPLRVQGTVIVREIPMMLLATGAVLVMALRSDLTGTEGSLERTEGLSLLLFFAVFLYALLVEAIRDRGQDPLAVQVESSPAAARVPAGWAIAGLILGGLLGLMAGGHLVVNSATEVGRAVGVPEVVIGMSVVAVGTSLPELVTSVVAAWRGEGDMAIGNVVGSNIFNLLFVLGVTTSITPITVPAGGFVDLLAALALSALLLPFAITHVRRLVRFEGALLLGAWLLYTGWRYLPAL